jgi:hypothetical protein
MERLATRFRRVCAAGIGILCIGYVCSPDLSRADPSAEVQNSQTSIVQVAAVLASKEGRGLDPRLKDLKPQLRGFPFKRYDLLHIEACPFRAGAQCGMELPDGGYLQMKTTESTPGHFKMRLLLIQDNRPVLNADVKLSRNANLLLRSSRTDAGTIIVSIRAPSQPAIESFETLKTGGE